MSQAINPFATHPERLEMTDAEVLARLLEEVEQPDERPVTMARLREQLPTHLYGEFRLSFITAKALAASESLEEKIFAEEIADTQAALAGGGFLLHTPQRQGLLDSMAPALRWSDELLTALKRVGIPVRYRWQIEGLAAEPTLEVLADWRTERVAELAEQAAAEQRRRDYAAIREALATLWSRGNHLLRTMESSGNPAPTLSGLIEQVGE